MAQAQEWRRVYGAAIVVPLILGFASFFEPFGRDQGIHATIGFALREGLVTYLDVYNIKPPLTTLVHAFSQMLFGHAMWSIRALDMVFFIAVLVGLVSLLRRWGGGPGQAAGTVLAGALIYYALSFWEHAQTDGWAGFLVVGALLLMTTGWAQAPGPARIARFAGAGAVLGLAFALKYTLGTMGLLVFAPLLSRGEARFVLADLWATVLGGLAVLAGVLGTLAAFGALGPFAEIQGYIGGYIAYDGGRPPFVREVLMVVRESTLGTWWFIAGIVAWIWGLVTRRAALMHGVIGLWALAGFLSGTAQGKGFLYHYLPMVPAAAMLCGLAVARMGEVLARVGVPRATLLILAALAVVTTFSRPMVRNGLVVERLRAPDPARAVWALLPDIPGFNALATVEFSDEISRHRAPGDTFFVWGYETMLYFLQREPPRYRYPYAWPFSVDFYDGRYTDDLMARLEADPPHSIVVQRDDAAPAVTGHDLNSDEVMDRLPRLAAFLDQGYALTAESPRFELWLRRAGAAASDSP